MKISLLITLALACFSASINAQSVYSAQADTIAQADSVDIDNIKYVQLIEENGKLTLVETGNKDGKPYTYTRTMLSDGTSMVSEGTSSSVGFELPFAKHGNDSIEAINATRKRWDFCINLGGIGWSSALATPSDLKTKMGKSYEANIDHLINVKYYPQGLYRTHFMIGLGMQWRRVALDNQCWMRDDETRQITYGPWDDSLYDRQSFVKTFSITLPVMIMQPLGYGLRVAAGVKACFNVNASVKNKYTFDDIKYTESFKHLNHNVVTAEICGAITWDGVGLYVNYAPCRVFKNGKGPKLNTFTVGIAVAY